MGEGRHAGPDRSHGLRRYRGLHSDEPIFNIGRDEAEVAQPTKVLEDLGHPHPGYSYPDHTQIIRSSRRRIVVSATATLAFAGLASWAVISVVTAGQGAHQTRLVIPAPITSEIPPGGGAPMPTASSPGGVPGPPVMIGTTAPLRSPVSPSALGPAGSPEVALDHVSAATTGPGAGTSVAAPTYMTRSPVAAQPATPASHPATHPAPTPADRPSATPSSQAVYECSTRIPGSAYAKWWVAHCKPHAELAPDQTSATPSVTATPIESVSP